MNPALLRTLLATPTVPRTTFFAQYLNEPSKSDEPAADPDPELAAEAEPAAPAEGPAPGAEPATGQLPAPPVATEPR